MTGRKLILKMIDSVFKLSRLTTYVNALASLSTAQSSNAYSYYPQRRLGSLLCLDLYRICSDIRRYTDVVDWRKLSLSEAAAGIQISYG